MLPTNLFHSKPISYEICAKPMYKNCKPGKDIPSATATPEEYNIRQEIVMTVTDEIELEVIVSTLNTASPGSQPTRSDPVITENTYEALDLSTVSAVLDNTITVA